MATRFLLGAVGVILISGAASAVLAREEIGRVVDALRQHKPVRVARDVLAPTSGGAPETLLLVGNDERPAPRDNPAAGPVLPHSNEMLLVRIDPSKPTISMLSIPRELRVPIDKPDGEVEENRINSAYTFGWENGGGTAGGVKLMVETIKRVLGLAVNHVFITNFTKFERAVDDMGCVYLTVDKRYFHSNSEPGAEQYMEIDLQPGYQRLCGKQAREYVSNRHESTSLIRDARDQRFLLEAKAQYGPSLFENREKFEHIFGRYVESTLESEEEVLQLLYLLAESAGKRVRAVDFHVNLGSSFDTATPEQIHAAVHSFLAGTAAIPRQRLRATAHPRRARHSAASSVSAAPLAATPGSTLAEARAMAPELPFAVEAPRYQDTTAEAEADALRYYDIRGSDGRLYPSYVIVVDEGELGQYYDVQGSAWGDPPLLSDPAQEIHVGSRDYGLFYDGEHLRTIAWHERGAAYWIENTLTNSVSPQQMLAIAQQTVPVIGAPGGPSGPAGPVLHVSLPPPAAPGAGQVSKLGALLGLPALAVLLALGVLVLVRQRQLRRLREQVEHAMALEARRRAHLHGSSGRSP